MIPTLDVDGLTQRVSELLESDDLLRSVRVRGEILDFKRHTSGHVYFTLTGRESRVSCVLFRSDAERIPRWPRKGDEVYAEGRVGVYGARGTYQLYARKLLPLGQGAKSRAREELRLRLEAEGLFDPRLKRPLPDFPLRAAVVTSPTGAAIRDVIKVSASRFPQCELVVVPAQVQGADAPAQIAVALQRLRYLDGVSVALLVRGGGSRDDLNPFDDEDVVRAVRLCPVPVVTGLGHEIDTTLADLASDASAPTPSAAAERVFPDVKSLLERLSALGSSLNAAMLYRIERLAAELSSQQSSLVSLTRDAHCRKALAQVEALEREICRSTRHTHTLWESKLKQKSLALDALSPLRVLARGYASCLTAGGEALLSVDQLDLDDPFSVELSDGEIKALVKGKNRFDRLKREVTDVAAKDPCLE